jgi:hypothetical protein
MSQRHRSAALGCRVVAALEATAAYGQESNPRNVSAAKRPAPRCLARPNDLRGRSDCRLALRSTRSKSWRNCSLIPGQGKGASARSLGTYEAILHFAIPDPGFWNDLGRLIVEDESAPNHFLLPRREAIPERWDPVAGRNRRYPLLSRAAMGAHGLHNWWYRCLGHAGVVLEGTRSGERMHKARHMAGQRCSTKTGNLKAVQKLLGDSSTQTTADISTDWDIDQLAASLSEVLLEDED